MEKKLNHSSDKFGIRKIIYIISIILQVDLFANGKNITNDKEKGVTWDPRNGFSVEAPTFELFNDVYCQSNLNGTIHKQAILIMPGARGQFHI